MIFDTVASWFVRHLFQRESCSSLTCSFQTELQGSFRSIFSASFTLSFDTEHQFDVRVCFPEGAISLYNNRLLTTFWFWEYKVYLLFGWFLSSSLKLRSLQLASYSIVFTPTHHYAHHRSRKPLVLPRLDCRFLVHHHMLSSELSSLHRYCQCRLYFSGRPSLPSSLHHQSFQISQV